MILDLRRLRVLQAVAHEGSLSGAARVLDFTQPAVGHHIRRLEAELGTPLALRRGRGVALTPAGLALAARADELLAAAAAAQEEVAAIAGLTRGRVRLVAFPSASATLVPPALARLQAEHPGLDVTLAEAEPPDSVDLVRRGEADVALSFTYDGEPDLDPEAGLTRTVLRVDEKLAVLPVGHALAGQREVDVARLSGERFIAGCPRCRRHLVHLCELAGFAPEIAYETDDAAAAQGMVAAGLGVTLLPGLALEVIRRPDVVVLPVRGRPTRTISAVTLRGAEALPSVGALLGALRAASG